METLTRMPAVAPARAKVLEIYRRQMAAALANQAPDGMWRQIIDAPGAYREETATAMLMSAMARGVRLGWLDRSYLPAIQRAWRGLSAHVTDEGTVIDVCAGTGAGPTQALLFRSSGGDRGRRPRRRDGAARRARNARTGEHVEIRSPLTANLWTKACRPSGLLRPDDGRSESPRYMSVRCILEVPYPDSAGPHSCDVPPAMDGCPRRRVRADLISIVLLADRRRSAERVAAAPAAVACAHQRRR